MSDEGFQLTPTDVHRRTTVTRVIMQCKLANLPPELVFQYQATKSFRKLSRSLAYPHEFHGPLYDHVQIRLYNSMATDITMYTVT
jgi:hypothetical protein